MCVCGPNGTWHLFNDAVVQPIHEAEVAKSLSARDDQIGGQGAQTGGQGAQIGGQDADPGVVDAGPGESGAAASDVGQTSAVPVSSSLSAYKSHAVAFLGRNLWCLDCFQAPGKDHRAWRHGRCEGTRPVAAMPSALRQAVARHAVATPELPNRFRGRLAELAGALEDR